MTHVYVIVSEEGPVKIGISRNIRRRVTAMGNEGFGPCHLYHATDPCKDASRVEMITHCLLAEFRIKGEWFGVKPNIAVETIYKALDMVAKGIGLDEKHRHKKWRRHAESLHDQGLVLVHVQIPRELESELYEIVHDWRERKEELNNERAN